MQTAVYVLSIVCIVLYAVSSCFRILEVQKHDDRYPFLAGIVVIVGFFAQGFLVAVLTLVSPVHFFSAPNTIVLIVWLALFAYCLFEVIAKTKRFGVIVLPTLTAALIASFLLRF